jgi:1,4-dihydroxy-2-naphthoate polyprenyltransferase
MSAPPVDDAGSTIRRFANGARPRTLPAALLPVAVGASLAWSAPASSTSTSPSWPHVVLALVVALALQVGTNYANDYADGVRGTDSARIGPPRLVGSGLASASAVRRAALCSFGVAALAGLALAAATSWWLVPVGGACIAAGWLYTGGPRPYGYLGLGEAFVFVFFGLVATVGTAYVAAGSLLAPAWPTGAAVGLLAVALLEANNLRDRNNDDATGKRTLAVRLGVRRAPWLYVGALAGASVFVVVVALWRPWAPLALLGMTLAVSPVRLVLSGAQGRALLPVLAATARLQLVVGALLVVGILL